MQNLYKIYGIILLLIGINACSNIAAINNNPAADQRMAAEYNVQLGLAYLQQQDLPRAKSKLLLALQEAPNWSVAQDAMAYYLQTTGEYTLAESYYLRALKLAPHTGAVLNNYGVFLCRQGQYIAAEKAFLSAVADPGYLNTADAYVNAGICEMLMPQKNVIQAKDYFAKAIQQDPQNTQAIRVLEQQLEKSQ